MAGSMENRSIGPKYIIILLSVLLIAGAIVAAINIDGGKWLTSNPVFAQPPEKALEQNLVAPVTGSGSGVETEEEQFPPSEYGCHHDSDLNPEDW